jgi:hypothetical protein
MVVSIFNDLELWLGRKCLERLRQPFWHLSWTTPAGAGVLDHINLIAPWPRILLLGLFLQELEKTSGFNSLLKKLRSRVDNCPEGQAPSIASELAEAEVAARYVHTGLKVELEPEVLVNGKIKHPDMRVLFDSTWIYIEVTTPETLGEKPGNKAWDLIEMKAGAQLSDDEFGVLAINLSLLPKHAFATWSNFLEGKKVDFSARARRLGGILLIHGEYADDGYHTLAKFFRNRSATRLIPEGFQELSVSLSQW